MHISISVSRPKKTAKAGADTAVSFYMDDPTIKHIFGRLSDIDRIYVLSVAVGRVRAFRLMPLKKGDLPPAGVVPVPVKTLKNKKVREYVVRSTVPKAWNLPLRSLTKKKVEYTAGQTEETLDLCLDIPILAEWLDPTALPKTEKAKPKDTPPAEPTPILTLNPGELLPSRDVGPIKRETGKTKEAPVTMKATASSIPPGLKNPPMVGSSKDSDDTRDILAKIEHTAGNLNMLIATAKAKGVSLDVSIKKEQVKIYRIVPARRKRLV